MTRNRDLAAAAAAALLCGAVCLAVPVEGIRVVAALPLALLLPGYALAAAVFARVPLGRPNLLLLTIALSLAALVLGSLLLDLLPGGLTTASWVALLVVITVGACLVAARRRRHHRPLGITRLRVRIRPADAVLLAGATALVVVAVTIALVSFRADDAVGYTRMWALPTDGGTAVRLGIANEDKHTRTFGLDVEVGGEPVAAPSRVVLGPGEEQIVTVQAELPPSGRAVRLVAILHKRTAPDLPYRRVTSWIQGS